jgi:tetratricopeptide (TPR) repeat protein
MSLVTFLCRANPAPSALVKRRLLSLSAPLLQWTPRSSPFATRDDDEQHSVKLKVQGLTLPQKHALARQEIVTLLQTAERRNVTQPAELVRALTDVALIYLTGGDAFLAAPFFEKALSLARDEFHATAPDAAQLSLLTVSNASVDLFLMCLRNVALVRDRERSHELVVQALTQSIDLLRKLPPTLLVGARGPSEPPVAVASLLCDQLEHCAVTNNVMGFSQRAIDALDAAIAMRLDPVSPAFSKSLLGHAYNLRGRVQRDAGRLSHAFDSHVKAHRAFAQAEARLEAAISRFMVAEVQFLAADYVEAKRHARVAIGKLEQLFPDKEHPALAGAYALACKIHDVTGGIVIAHGYKEQEIAVVEALLRRRHGEVGEHAKVVQLRAELAALAARVKQRSYENQLRYRNKRDEKKESEDLP